MRRAALIALAAGALVTACGSGSGSQASSSPTGANGGPGGTAAASRGVRLAQVGRFDQPVYVTSPRGDARHLFVVERTGRIQVLSGGRQRTFLDLRSQVTSGGQEQGLLSIAFAPDYARSGLFYVYFTDRAQNERVVEFKRASATRADPASERLVLRMDDPEPNHNGGLLLFGPDRHMYIGTGDGGGGGDLHGPHGNAQNLGSLLGKILRIDPRQSGGRAYTVPRANPFVGRSGARPEIYAYGLRNPWRFSFDRKTGDLVIGDVGQDAVEEIDFVGRGRGRGANFGWRVFEGRSRYTPGENAPGAIMPVITRLHSHGWCSITGGVVIREPALRGVNGRYLFGDFCKQRIQAARLSAGQARSVQNTSLKVSALSSFGEDSRGRVYAVSLEGPVYRLVPR